MSSWEIRALLWPQLLRVTHEKSYVVQKLDKVIEGVLKSGTCTSPLVLNVPDSWLRVIAQLTRPTPPPPSLSSWVDLASTETGSLATLQNLCSAEDIKSGRAFLQQVNMKFHK